jgi:tryptophan synthase alpha subunit
MVIVEAGIKMIFFFTPLNPKKEAYNVVYGSQSYSYYVVVYPA